MFNGTERLSQGRAVVMRFHSSRKNGAFKILALLFVEFVLLFVIGEAIARLFLPPGLRVIHPQMLIDCKSTLIRYVVIDPSCIRFDQPFVTNSMGLRDHREVPLDKAGEFRLLSLGDSMAVGLGVSVGDTYANQDRRPDAGGVSGARLFQCRD